MSKRIHVIINPASGHPEPVLNTLNNVFYPAGVDWDVSITQRSGDAKKFAQRAVESGVDIVAAYGGDGTVMEVARGLRHSQTPMAILPGGTANLMTVELGIPKDLAKASEIAVSENSRIRKIDLGQAGENYFILRVGIGLQGKKVEVADRELKDRFGVLAYTVGAIKALKETNVFQWKVTLDGKKEEFEGLSLLVDNAGTFGIKGLSHSQQVSVDDGLLDVIIVHDVGFASIYSMGASIADRQPDPTSFRHWQAREIRIEADPPALINGDGEIWGTTPVDIRVIPAAVNVIVPAG
jgi:YegS/Rv2252/BmrU family lipid kinase